MTGIPLLTVGQVVALDPEQRLLTIVLRTSFQSFGVPVKMGHSVFDALRVSQRPMPGRGTWGLIAFPYGDDRNGIWLCAMPPSFIDAVTTTTSGAPAPTDPFIDYESHFSGWWRLLDGTGNEAIEWSDGTSLVIGSGTSLPTVYRHTVDSGQNRQKIPFLPADRIPTPPSAYNITLATKSGITFSVSASGAVTVSGATANPFTIAINGTTFVIGPSGALTVTGAPGQTSTFAFGGSTVEQDAFGNVDITLGSGGKIVVNGGGDALALVSKLMATLNALSIAFDTHTHGGVTAGDAITAPPSTSWSPSAFSSADFNVNA